MAAVLALLPFTDHSAASTSLRLGTLTILRKNVHSCSLVSPKTSTSTKMTEKKRTTRLVEVDALRGLAALAVVLFHYTTRFSELYGSNPAPTISSPDGPYGV